MRLTLFRSLQYSGDDFDATKAHWRLLTRCWNVLVTHGLFKLLREVLITGI